MDTATPASPSTMVATRAASTLSVARTIVIFAVAYAVVDFALGILPVNLMLRHFMSAVMARVWLGSFLRLVLGTLVSAAGCAATLRATGRVGGALASTMPRGVMSIGAITAGAIAGALDVAVHRLLVWQLIHLAQRTTIGAELLAALLTFMAAAIVTVILVVPRTRVVRGEDPSADVLQPTEQPA